MIGLIDIDSKYPNLALMKISSYYKSLGEEVEFMQFGKKYEKIYASTIFTKSIKETKKILNIYPDAVIGGTGWDIKKRLPKEIEKMSPDYSLYGIDYGIGFTRRGCCNNCGFCFVPKKEKWEEDTPIEKLLNSKKLFLLDNNFTQDPNMIEKAKFIVENNITINITNGVNIRVMTDEKAYWLGKMKHEKQLHIAWDNIKDEKRVMEGLKVLSKYMKLYKVMCYVLVGYNTTLEEDLYRIKKLNELNIDPLVMIYNQKPDPVLKHLARWCNKPWIRKSCGFEQYKPYVLWKSTKGQIKMAL